MEQTYGGYRFRKKWRGKNGDSCHILQVRHESGAEYKQLALRGALPTIQNWVVIDPETGRILSLGDFPQNRPQSLNAGEINCWYYLRSWGLIHSRPELQKYIEGFEDIRIYDYAGEWIFILQPWSRATSLQEVARNPDFQLLPFLSVYFEFLADFHRSGLCLYDISAGNILFDMPLLFQGSKVACRLIDFEFLMISHESRTDHKDIRPHYLQSAVQLNGLQYFPDDVDKFLPSDAIDPYLDYRVSFMMMKTRLGKRLKTSDYRKLVSIPFDSDEIAYRKAVLRSFSNTRSLTEVVDVQVEDVDKQETLLSKMRSFLISISLPELRTVHYMVLVGLLITFVAGVTLFANSEQIKPLRRYKDNEKDDRTIEEAALDFDELMDIYHLNPEAKKFKELAKNTHRKMRVYLEQQQSQSLSDKKKTTVQAQRLYWLGKAPLDASGCSITGKLTWDQSDFSACLEYKEEALALYNADPKTKDRYVLLAYSLWGTVDCIEHQNQEHCLQPITVSKQLYSKMRYPTWLRIEAALNYALIHSWLHDIVPPFDEYKTGCQKIIKELKEYSPYENLRLATSRCLKASGDYRTWIEWAEIYRDFYHPSIFEKPWNRSSIRSKLMIGLPKRSCQKKPYRPTQEITALEEQSFCSWAADSILNGSFSSLPETLEVPWYLLLFQESDLDKFGWKQMKTELLRKGYFESE